MRSGRGHACDPIANAMRPGFCAAGRRVGKCASRNDPRARGTSGSKEPTEPARLTARRRSGKSKTAGSSSPDVPHAVVIGLLHKAPGGFTFFRPLAGPCPPLVRHSGAPPLARSSARSANRLRRCTAQCIGTVWLGPPEPRVCVLHLRRRPPLPAPRKEHCRRPSDGTGCHRHNIAHSHQRVPARGRHRHPNKSQGEKRAARLLTRHPEVPAP